MTAGKKTTSENLCCHIRDGLDTENQYKTREKCHCQNLIKQHVLIFLMQWLKLSDSKISAFRHGGLCNPTQAAPGGCNHFRETDCCKQQPNPARHCCLLSLQATGHAGGTNSFLTDPPAACLMQGKGLTSWHDTRVLATSLPVPLKARPTRENRAGV